MMLILVAPSALRTPISRVRSVTVTSMMFMMPMPPTTSETAAMLASRLVKIWVVACWVARISWDPRIMKSLSPPGRILCSRRMIRSMSTCTWVIGTPSRPSTAMERSRSVPKTRYWAVLRGMKMISSGFCHDWAAPLGCSTPITSKLIPRMAMVCPIRACGLAFRSRGISAATTA